MVPTIIDTRAYIIIRENYLRKSFQITAWKWGPECTCRRICETKRSADKRAEKGQEKMGRWVTKSHNHTFVNNTVSKPLM